MKNLISILTLVVISVMLNSCGDSASQVPNPETEVAIAPAPVLETPKPDTAWKTPTKFSLGELTKEVYTNGEYDGANAEYAHFDISFEVGNKTVTTGYSNEQTGHSYDEPFTAIDEAKEIFAKLKKKKVKDFEIQYIGDQPVCFRTKEVWTSNADSSEFKYEAPIVIWQKK